MKRLKRRFVWRVFWLSFETSAIFTLETAAKLARLRRKLPW